MSDLDSEEILRRARHVVSMEETLGAAEAEIIQLRALLAQAIKERELARVDAESKLEEDERCSEAEVRTEIMEKKLGEYLLEIIVLRGQVQKKAEADRDLALGRVHELDEALAKVVQGRRVEAARVERVREVVARMECTGPGREPCPCVACRVAAGAAMTARVECSTCKGTGTTLSFVDYGPERSHESGLYSIPCPQCAGVGSMTAAEHTLHLRLRAEGARLRAYRVAGGWSLSDLAKRMGVSPTAISSWERGKTEMSATCRAWMEKP